MKKKGKIINDFHVAQFNKRDNLLTYTGILYLARNDREHVASARFTVLVLAFVLGNRGL